MKYNPWFFVITISLLVLLGFPLKARAEGISYLLKTQKPIKERELEGILGEATSSVEEIPALSLFKIKTHYELLSSPNLRQLEREFGLEFLEPDSKVKIASWPNDPLVRGGAQYSVGVLGLEEVWPSNQGSTEITVGLIDTGVQASHPELSGKIASGFNFLSQSDISEGADSDDNGHGTALASLIAGKADNGIGIAGVAPQVRIAPLKAIASCGAGRVSDIALAITWGTNRGLPVLNLSLGTSTHSEALFEAVKYAKGKGVILVAAPGNAGQNSIFYPAAYEEVIAVGSTNVTDTYSHFSNWGRELDISAPGEGVVAANRGGGFVYLNGTSAAAANLTGVVALLLSRKATLTPEEAYQLLIETAEKPAQMGGQNRTDRYGYGRVSARQAYQRLVDSLPFASFSLVSQTGSVELPEGQARELTLVIRNLGKATWTQDKVHIAAVDQNGAEGRTPSFLREPNNPSTSSGWVGPNKVQMVESDVPPGKLATFKFWFKTPAGHPKIKSKEYFRPEFDNVTQLENRGIFFEVIVP